MPRDIDINKLEEAKEEQYKTLIPLTITTWILVGYFMGLICSISEHDKITILDAFFKLTDEFKLFYYFNFGFIKGYLYGALIAFGIVIFYYFNLRKNEGANLRGAEVDTSRFATKKEILEKTFKFTPEIIEKENVNFRDSFKENPDYANIILSKNVRRPNNARHITGNNNMIVVGGAGSGKSQGIVIPAILQMNSNYVITDPSGELIEATGNALRENGYKIKVFNISNMKYSNCYNPLKYIETEQDVQTVIECLITNTSTSESAGENQFFVDAEKLLYSACIFYLKDFSDDLTRKNFAGVLELINSSSIDENNVSGKTSELDKMFGALPQESLAAKYYKAFKQAAGKTLKAIIISCVVRLGKFMIPEVASLTNTDDIDLGMISEEKTALFIITSQVDETYNFLAAIMYTQLYLLLYRKGEDKLAKTGDARLNYPVKCIHDEFANAGKVPSYPSRLATMRKYDISSVCIIQDINQLIAMYKDEWKTILNNCSIWVYLGGNIEPESLKFFSDALGQKTIRTRSESYNTSGGSSSSGSVSNQASGRSLMTVSELSRMDSSKCIIIQYGSSIKYPIMDDKYRVIDFQTKECIHPRAYLTAYADSKNAFKYQEMEAYRHSRANITLAKARAEAKRYKNKLEKNKEIDGTENITLPENIEKKYYDDLFNNLLDTVAYEDDVVILAKNIPFDFFKNYIPNIEKQIMTTLGKETLAIGFDAGKYIYIYVQENNRNINEQKTKNIYTKNSIDSREEGNVLAVAVSLDNFENYKNALKKNLNHEEV